MSKTVYFSAMLEFGPKENPTRSACINATKDSLNDCLADAFDSATYYLLECGYPCVSVDIRESCERCNGEGIIRLKVLRNKPRICPDCKGKDSQRTVVHFPAVLNECAVKSLASSNYKGNR